MNKHLLLTTILVITCIACSCADELPFTSDTISESFGPRIHPVRHEWQFHNGIDYNPKPGNSDYGLPIKSVEDGVFVSIDHKGSGGWVCTLQSGTRQWQYMHTFSDNALPIIAGIFTLGKDKFGIFIERKPHNGKKSAIFRPIKQQNIGRGEEFTALGTSGIGTGAHLHLQLNGGKNNPLSVLEHANSNYKITLKEPSPNDDYIDGNNLLTNYPLLVQIDSSEGKDIDMVKLYIDNNEVLNGEFNFGGLPDKQRLLMQPTCYQARNGVDPDAKNSALLTFLCEDDITVFKKGKQVVIVKATSVKWKGF